VLSLLNPIRSVIEDVRFFADTSGNTDLPKGSRID
jgi:hypothetical protein